MDLCSENSFETVPFNTNGVNGSLKSSNVQKDSCYFVEVDEDYIKSDIPKLMKLIHDVYDKRLIDIENNKTLNENEKTKEKGAILHSYVYELQKQNDTFASTMIELEKEAHQRVKQMEKRLNSSARTTMEAVINIHKCEKEMRRLVDERLYVESLFKDTQQHLSSLKVENGFLRDQNCNLNHDVQALLHVIHHARSTGHWEMDCVTFCEVTPEQVFGPVQSISHHYETEYENTIQNREDPSECVPHIYRASETLHSDLLRRDGNSKQQSSPFAQTFSSCLPKCASLPEIGNVYSYNQDMHKSNSYDTDSNSRPLCVKLSKKYKNGANKNQGTPELLKNMTHIQNLEDTMCNRKGQSEPHLFMFNDNIYKYRPCENIENASSAALIESYELSLPAYQSIDLKFPTEDETLKINAWNKLKSGSYLDALENSFMKDHTSNSSCSCFESEARGINRQMFKLFGERFISGAHIKRKVSKSSIGLQTEIDQISRGTQTVLDDDAHLELDSSVNTTLQILRDDLLKAKDKAEEKKILIEQLQNHLTLALKEVELKDKALENLERKLQISRDECFVVRNKNGDLNSKLELILKDMEDSHSANINLKKQNEQQGQIIRNLQEALVQSKRAFDAAHSNLPSESFQSKNRQTSKSSVIDI